MQFLSKLTLLTAAASAAVAAPVEERANGLGHFQVTDFQAQGIPHSSQSVYGFHVKYHNADHPGRNFNTRCEASVTGAPGGLAKVPWTTCQDKDVEFKWTQEIDGYQLYIRATNTKSFNSFWWDTGLHGFGIDHFKSEGQGNGIHTVFKGPHDFKVSVNSRVHVIVD